MLSKQQIVIELLKNQLSNTKVGIMVKGIDSIDPLQIVISLTNDINEKLFFAFVGYSNINCEENDNYTISDSIEKAVLWRSIPSYAGKIMVFIKNDSDKLHSLAEFDVISMRDLSHYLIDSQIEKDNNAPTHAFWEALSSESDYYLFDDIADFVSFVQKNDNKSNNISPNMWRLNLLCDPDILNSKNKPGERLRKNRELIFAIGQLSAESRKKISKSLSKTTDENKSRLQKAYQSLQSFYKYGKKETLKELDYNTVQELFMASKKKKTEKTPGTPSSVGGNGENGKSAIRKKELEKIISDSVISGDDSVMKDLNELLDSLKRHYDPDTSENEESIPPIGGVFEYRNIEMINSQTDLRKLVGRVCNESTWGALLDTEEQVLKDAISADKKNEKLFSPVDRTSCISFQDGIDGNQSLFDFLVQFDVKFKEQNNESLEFFSPILEELRESRIELCRDLDLIMYYPVLLFGADDKSRNSLIRYIRTWERLYHAFVVNEPTMRAISPDSTGFIARSLLLLDTLYIKTPKEWKAILLPLHPLFLWKYYEIFRILPTERGIMEEEDKHALSEVLSKLPQILSFVTVNKLLTGTVDDKVLPCSGTIEMLPTFENKTNRYLGDDGTTAVSEILTRWIGFAPYTKNEVRICTIDAPELNGIIQQIKKFMDDNHCLRVVYDVYLTHNQNGNTELSKFDYSGKDYEIGEYLKSSKITVSIKNLPSARDVKEALTKKPVHVAFYFDQSSYAIEFGPSNKNLYITPLVVTYEYNFDTMQHRGSIYPSSETDSGLIGDYHKLMKSADVISNNMIPRTNFIGNVDMTDVVSTIRDGQTQWLAVADRDTNSYQPQNAIPIGEMQYDKRMVNVWASSKSRIISQYMSLLRGYNLDPREDILADLLKRFGHIASSGLISIPKFGSDMQAIENKKKGLIGTLFAASWYSRHNDDSLVASLDNDKARLWLRNSKYGNERADLVGFSYQNETNTLFIQPIEVKTRDESEDYTIEKDDGVSTYSITGHATDQVASTVEMLKEIFSDDEHYTDMFTSARREVLKYQIVTECFRNVHDIVWQERWCGILKKAFGNGRYNDIHIVISGIILHIQLSSTTGGTHIVCHAQDFEDVRIDFWKLTSQDIQQHVLDVNPPFQDNNHCEEGNRQEKDNQKQPEDDKTTEESSEDHGSSDIVTDEQNGKKADIVKPFKPLSNVSQDEIEQLVVDFKRSCNDYHVNLKECNSSDSVVGPSVIRIKFRLARGQSLQGLNSHIEDIGREMKRSGVIVQSVPNSDELLLDVPRLQRERVLFSDVINKIPQITSPEQLYFPLGRTPNGKDLIEDLGQMPHMLVGGSTGSGKSVFLFSMLATLIMTHPKKEDMQLILSSSKLEDFIHFEGLPHLYSNSIISDAVEATNVIKDVIFKESERRGKLLAEARVANIIEYNKKMEEKLAPIVVVIDEFADLADQLETKKERDAFFKPVQRIAQAGRSRGIHLVICTQRPEAKLVPPTTKAQLNGRVALRVNDGISSRMIIETPDAQYLQKHGDMIYKNSDIQERAQGYLIEVSELDEIVSRIRDL